MENFVKLIPRKTIEEMIDYRDGKVELSDKIIDEVDNFSDFVVCNKMDLSGLPHGYGTHLYHKDDKEHQYPVSYTDAYCQIHYNMLKEHVCKILDIPNYVYLDLEYMLSKYLD